MASPQKLIVLGSGTSVPMAGRTTSCYLVDPGDGHALAIDLGPGALQRAAAAGYDLDHLRAVLLTHMHFDHGGGISKQVGGELRPTFPDAVHLLQRRNLETARDPNPREAASYLVDNLSVLDDVNLELIDGPAELLPGISVIPSDGHTDGMQAVRVEGGGRVLYYLADLAPTRHHLQCNRPKQRQLLLAKICAEPYRRSSRLHAAYLSLNCDYRH